MAAAVDNLDSLWKQRARDERGETDQYPTETPPSPNTANPSTAPEEEEEEDDRPSPGFFSDAAAFVTGAFGSSSQDAQERAVQRLVDHVRRGRGGSLGATVGNKPDGEEGDVRDMKSFGDILSLLRQQVIGDVTATGDGDDSDELKSRLDRVAGKYVGDRLSSSFVAALGAYLEHEDEVKNPSWKRRMHRYYPGIRMEHLEELYRGLILAYYAYGDTEDEIRSNLNRRGYELLNCDLTSAPGRPAHYVAVQRSRKGKPAGGDKSWFSLLSSSSSCSSGLPVVIVVRGTKTLADVLTDLLCESCEYRGGKAHAYIVAGGRYLAQKQAPLLRQLAEISGMDLRVTLVGHSLGAGAATIAGIELANDPDHPCAVNVMGFGCPALLSRGLAEEVSSYVTTVINDGDVVPRLSGASIANLLTDVSSFDWFPYIKRDIQHTLDEFFPPQVSESIMTTVEPHLKSFVESSGKDLPEQERLAPELYPPGRCIHFYSDGYGISAAVVPNDFFNEIDVNRRMIDGTDVPSLDRLDSGLAWMSLTLFASL
jgi:hypothetical protein